MTESDFVNVRAEYIRAHAGADAARDAWSAFLSTTPLDQQEPPALSGNIIQAHADVIVAEALERKSRDALYELIRPHA